MSKPRKIVALCGGIGGAKLALGLSRTVPAENLVVVANTGDDFEHLGLLVTPDIDTILYTLAGISNRETGWGRADETWNFMGALAELGGETWFQLGDKDLAQNVRRTRLISDGASLSKATDEIRQKLGIDIRVTPMSDAPVRTVMHTDRGRLDFQDYFVRFQCPPVVSRIEFDGAAEARPSPLFRRLLDSHDVAAFILCPSNPYLSIDPILAIPTVKTLLASHPAPVIAVSPIVGRDCVKGPTTKLMNELGHEPTPGTVAGHYGSFLNGFVIDRRDDELTAQTGSSHVRVVSTDILMNSLEDKMQLAEFVLGFAEDLWS